MKKLVSIVLVAMLFMSSIISVGAYDPYPPKLFEDKFVEQHMTNYDGVVEDYYYDELYCHYDENGQVDWALVSAYSMMGMPMPINKVICDRVLMSNSRSVPFSFGYAVYDVKNDCFVEISEDMLRYYDGLTDYWMSKKVGKLIGDTDSDGELTILDATYIQRALAMLCDFAESDLVTGHCLSEKIRNISDFDRDGDRTILDATAIQMRLARLDEPIGEDDLVITKEAAYNYYIFPEMPEDSTSVEFEVLYTLGGTPPTNPNIYFEDYSDDVYAIVKTKEQYDQVLNIYNDEFDEEFFETHYAFVAVRRTSNLNMLAPVTDMRIKGNKLYFAANEIYPAGDLISPMESFYTSISAVEKSALKDVTDIQRVKRHYESIFTLVIKQTSEPFDYSGEIPADATAVEFEPKFNYSEGYNVTSCNEYWENGYTLSIIKSKEQYDCLYNTNSDSFTDEFFETHYLVAATTMGTCGEAKLPISHLGVKDNTLYVIANQYTESETVTDVLSYYTSVVAVEKSALKDVTQIVRVR